MWSAKRIAVIVFMCMCCLSTGFCDESQKQPDPYKNTSILVEAMVVRISSKALSEEGVKPIGQTQQEVLKIIACLADPEKAEVISGVKGITNHGEVTQIHNGNSVYVTMKKGTAVESLQFSNSFELAAVPKIVANSNVLLEYNSSINFFDESEDKASYPITHQYEWQGSISASSGNPIVAAAVQDNDSMTFLILCATIQKSND